MKNGVAEGVASDSHDTNSHTYCTKKSSEFAEFKWKRLLKLRFSEEATKVWRDDVTYIVMSKKGVISSNFVAFLEKVLTYVTF